MRGAPTALTGAKAWVRTVGTRESTLPETDEGPAGTGEVAMKPSVKACCTGGILESVATAVESDTSSEAADA